MARIVLATEGQKLIKVECPKIASGDKNVDYLRVNFCPSWDGFAKTAVFYRNESEIYYATMSNNECVIPWEVLQTEGLLYLGVFGAKDNTRKTSEVISCKIDKGAIVDNLKPSDPTPDIYDQIMTAVSAVTGFGLGKLGQTDLDICCETDEALKMKRRNGFWAYRNKDVDLISGISSKYVKGITLAYSEGAVTQIGVCNSNGIVIIRELYDSNWTEWRRLIDAIGAVPTNRKINGFSLSDDINLTADKVGAAPAGFGLGILGAPIGGTSEIECTTAEQLNNLGVNGFWAYRNADVPLISNDTAKNTTFVKGITFGINANAATQIGFCNNNNKLPRLIIREKMTDWGEWEWVNPPMNDGVEYRTPERYNGKPVYTKTVKVAALPATNKYVDVWITDETIDVLDFHVMAYNNDLTFKLPLFTTDGVRSAFARVVNGVVRIFSSTTVSNASYSGKVFIKYTKG